MEVSFLNPDTVTSPDPVSSTNSELPTSLDESIEHEGVSGNRLNSCVTSHHREVTTRAPYDDSIWTVSSLDTVLSSKTKSSAFIPPNNNICGGGSSDITSATGDWGSIPPRHSVNAMKHPEASEEQTTSDGYIGGHGFESSRENFPAYSGESAMLDISGFKPQSFAYSNTDLPPTTTTMQYVSDPTSEHRSELSYPSYHQDYHQHHLQHQQQPGDIQGVNTVYTELQPYQPPQHHHYQQQQQHARYPSPLSGSPSYVPPYDVTYRTGSYGESPSPSRRYTYGWNHGYPANHGGAEPHEGHMTYPGYSGELAPHSGYPPHDLMLATRLGDAVVSPHERVALGGLDTSRLSAWTVYGEGGCKLVLFNGDMWSRFHVHTNEMIITKHGRRMFPVLHFVVSGLQPNKSYHVYVDMVVADSSHWKFQAGKWVSCGNAEALPPEGRVYHHPDSPNTGSHWMKQDVTFGKLKLTNNKNCQQKQVILNSMHRYQPRIHISEDINGEEGKVILSHAFVETQFIAVTAYQNTDITQLKIDNNPFAKGFRDSFDSRVGMSGSPNMEGCQPPMSSNPMISPHNYMHNYTAMTASATPSMLPTPAIPRPPPMVCASPPGPHRSSHNAGFSNTSTPDIQQQQQQQKIYASNQYHSLPQYQQQQQQHFLGKPPPVTSSDPSSLGSLPYEVPNPNFLPMTSMEANRYDRAATTVTSAQYGQDMGKMSQPAQHQEYQHPVKGLSSFDIGHDIPYTSSELPYFPNKDDRQPLTSQPSTVYDVGSYNVLPVTSDNKSFFPPTMTNSGKLYSMADDVTSGQRDRQDMTPSFLHPPSGSKGKNGYSDPDSSDSGCHDSTGLQRQQKVETEVAVEFGKLQRQAAELSLDFMSKDIGFNSPHTRTAETFLTSGSPNQPQLSYFNPVAVENTSSTSQGSNLDPSFRPGSTMGIKDRTDHTAVQRGLTSSHNVPLQSTMMSESQLFPMSNPTYPDLGTSESSSNSLPSSSSSTSSFPRIKKRRLSPNSNIPAKRVVSRKSPPSVKEDQPVPVTTCGSTSLWRNTAQRISPIGSDPGIRPSGLSEDNNGFYLGKPSATSQSSLTQLSSSSSSMASSTSEAMTSSVLTPSSRGIMNQGRQYGDSLPFSSMGLGHVADC